MKKLQGAWIFIIFISALFAQSAFALQFTYTSNSLFFKQGYIGGEEDNTINHDNSPTPSFNVSFITATDNLTTSLLFGDLSFSATEYSGTLADIPAIDSNITFNDDGSIAGWHFVLALSKIILQNQDTPPNILSWFIESSYGDNTCNCDQYKTEFDIYTHPNDNWEYLTTIGTLYDGENSIDSWSIKDTKVPEPMSYLLFLSGIVIIGFVRLQKNNKKYFIK